MQRERTSRNPASFQRGLHHAARAALGAVFVWAGLAKLSDVQAFSERVADFGLVLDGLVMPTAWSIAAAELLAGLALIGNLRGSLIAVCGLLGVFVAVLAYGIHLGLDIDCGCFGAGLRIPLKVQLWIDAGLLAWCGLVYCTRVRAGIRTFDLGSLRFVALAREQSL